MREEVALKINLPESRVQVCYWLDTIGFRAISNHFFFFEGLVQKPTCQVPTAGAASSKCQSKFGQAASEEGKESATDWLQHEFASLVAAPRLALQASSAQSQLEWRQHQSSMFFGHFEQFQVRFGAFGPVLGFD